MDQFWRSFQRTTLCHYFVFSLFFFLLVEKKKLDSIGRELDTKPCPKREGDGEIRWWRWRAKLERWKTINGERKATERREINGNWQKKNEEQEYVWSGFINESWCKPFLTYLYLFYMCLISFLRKKSKMCFPWFPPQVMTCSSACFCLFVLTWN